MAGKLGRSGRRAKLDPATLRADGRALTVAPPCPDWLQGAGAEMWERVAPWLCEQRILHLTDLATLQAFCSSYGRYRAGLAEIELYGILIPGANNTRVKNPAGSVVSQAAQQMTTFGAMLGLDPASRRRLLGPDRPAGAEGNPFASLLRH